MTFKIWHRHYNIFFGKSCRQLIKAVIGQNFFNIICFVKASQMRCLSQWYLFFLLLGDVVSDISFTLTLNAQLLHTADIPGARMIKVKTLHLQELLSPKDCLLMSRLPKILNNWRSYMRSANKWYIHIILPLGG